VHIDNYITGLAPDAHFLSDRPFDLFAIPGHSNFDVLGLIPKATGQIPIHLGDVSGADNRETTIPTKLQIGHCVTDPQRASKKVSREGYLLTANRALFLSSLEGRNFIQG